MPTYSMLLTFERVQPSTLLFSYEKDAVEHFLHDLGQVTASLFQFSIYKMETFGMASLAISVF